MIYLFPIFLFGCVVTGVVVIGIVEAGEQVKRAEAVRKMQDLAPNAVSPTKAGPEVSEA